MEYENKSRVKNYLKLWFQYKQLLCVSCGFTGTFDQDFSHYESFLVIVGNHDVTHKTRERLIKFEWRLENKKIARVLSWIKCYSFKG